MGFKDFLRDRRVYIAVFLGFNGLTVAVVQLDLWFAGSALRIGNVLYVALLGAVGLAVWLTIDYARQRTFYRQFDEQLDEQLGGRSLDEMSVLDEPVTREQALYTDAWHRLYGRLRADLVAERELNRRRIELITQWVHHMKTPVAVIDLELQKSRRAESRVSEAGSEAAIQGKAPADTRLIDSIAEENERLRHALHMLLNMIRLDDFTADFKIEPVDLIATVRDVINEQRRTFITHNVFPKIEDPGAQSAQRATTAPPPPSPRVHSDVKWLKFVLDQIVRNAIHYSAKPDGSGNVTFRFQKDDKGTILEIADDGRGIKPEDLGRLFAPFFTGTGGREHRYATGMGLYLAKETCRKLGHDLTVRSVHGQGTTVRIHFPDATSLYADLRDGTAAEVEM